MFAARAATLLLSQQKEKTLRRTLVLLAVFLAWAPGARAGEVAGPDACADCHSDIFETWKNSKHAKAYEEELFQKAWTENRKDPACLECHTSGHQAGTAQFVHGGVSCESCHGALDAGHPDSAKMPIPASSEMCAGCHKKTYQEWKISRHGEKGIRCFDCHNVHENGLRAGGGDALCGSCHQGRLSDFAHSTHHEQGLGCATCHMPSYAQHATAIEGTGAAAHTCSVGADVCTRCHEETVHKSNKLPQLREKVTEFSQQMAVAGIDNVFDLNEEAKSLKWRLSRSRQAVWVTGILSWMIGLLLGWLGAWLLYGRRR